MMMMMKTQLLPELANANELSLLAPSAKFQPPHPETYNLSYYRVVQKNGTPVLILR